MRLSTITLIWLLVVANAAGSDLTLMVTEASGYPARNCEVTHFRNSGNEYRNKFRGLVGRGIPNGTYEASIMCGTKEMVHRVRVERSNQFAVLGFSARKFAFDSKLGLTLSVRLINPPERQANVWWIRLVGLYNGKTYFDRFSPSLDEAILYNPEPGIYQVFVYSNTGYVCSHEVEFIEFTKAWTFNASTCVFGFDEFAHLVERDAEHKVKRGSWDQEMEKFREEWRPPAMKPQ